MKTYPKHTQILEDIPEELFLNLEGVALIKVLDQQAVNIRHSRTNRVVMPKTKIIIGNQQISELELQLLEIQLNLICIPILVRKDQEFSMEVKMQT